MKVNMINSKGILYHECVVYNEYERIEDEDNDRVIYTYNAAVIEEKEKISDHYGYLQYVGNGYFFFVPFMFMEPKVKVGLFKMKMNEGKLEPFSEEIICEDIRENSEEITKFFEDNELSFGIELLDDAFNPDTDYFMSYCCMEYKGGDDPEYKATPLLPSNFKNPIPEKSKVYEKK